MFFAKVKKKGEEMEMNMTPMIDVVFQLIIFFMLVTEMSQVELEMLDLPSASMARPDKGDDDRIIVNIMEPGKDGTCDFRVRGRVYSLIQLREYLRLEASISRDPANPRLSTKPVLMRSDVEAPFRYVQAVMQECARPGIGIYKVQFAVKEPPAGTGEHR